MAAPLPEQDPLAAHFSGKRRHDRVPCPRPVELCGATGRVVAQLHDLSAGGAHVEVLDEAFYLSGREGEASLALVERAFPDGLVLHFSPEDVHVAADIVRIVPHENGLLGMGCRFRVPLSDVEAVLLGVGVSREADLAGASGDRPSARRLFALVYDGSKDLIGPRLAAHVIALKGRSLVLSEPGPTHAPRRLAQDLAGKTLQAVVMKGRRRLWEGPVRLAAIGPAEGDGPLRLHLRLAVDPGPQARRIEEMAR